MFTTIGSALANPNQVAENLPASLVGLASAIPKVPQEFKPKYGMAMRFGVSIYGISFGHWASCQGLKMEFKSTQVQSGGEYTTARWLPNEVAFGKIVLRRAVEPETSKRLQAWLSRTAMDWMRDGDPANSTLADGAEVTLCNSDDEVIMSWKLRGVRPSSWSGPDLDANSSKVALETLELVHEGFEVVVKGAAAPVTAPPSAGLPSGPQPFVLTDEMGRSVQFPYRPTKLTVGRTTETQAFGTTSGDTINGGDRPDVTTLAASNMVITGTATKDNVNLLIEWATKGTGSQPTIGTNRGSPGGGSSSGGFTPGRAPGGSRGGGGKGGGGGKVAHHLPKLTLAWGDLQYDVKMKTINAVYTRFSSSGKPMRADVGFTLIVLTPAQKGTNPSSGGIPGRGSHLVLQEETLPMLANDRYGSSGNWRDVAEANGIDDPLRVRPGTRLYLPAPSELAGRR